jgi:hypothetical protein
VSALGGACQAIGDPETGGIGTSDAKASAVGPNRALAFAQDYVQVPDHPDLDVRNTWTLEAWVYPRGVGSGADEDLISKWAGVSDAAYILQVDGATGRLRLVTNNGATQSIILSDSRLTNDAGSTSPRPSRMGL